MQPSNQTEPEKEPRALGRAERLRPGTSRVLPASRLDRLPPYLFAELERKVSEKKAAGVDVISLGIGDPDTPTPANVVEALAAAAADPGTHQYPSNRGRPELREAFARFYQRRFGVTLDPDAEIVPALGAKECVFNLNLAMPG
jgi:LL-diaminopimelate aminotransferase